MSSRYPDGSALGENAAQAQQKREHDGEADRTDHQSEDKRSKRRKTGSAEKLPKAKRVGNFRSYYAYRLGQRTLGALEVDPRLSVLDKAWFAGRRGLDIGCNSGEFTIAIAKHMEPAALLGVDVDPDLVSRARANLREVLQHEQIQKAFNEIAEQETGGGCEADAPRSLQHEADKSKGGAEDSATSTNGASSTEQPADAFAHEMPLSFRLWKAPAPGKCAVPRTIGKTPTGTSFPLNVVFKREDIVVDAHSGGNYDFITCFSVTKWIHLFHGDDGIKTLFARIFAMLTPGGRFIFEPQPWKSYHKRKFTSEVTAANYDAIQLRPKDFSGYLMDSVGFRSCEFLQVCQTSAKGFRRPVYVAKK